ncbi:hypothetical protein [Streptomyces morookaense]|uniref:Uncharacterized protein n=1 Tax=Streptomyces morookaense TaxID=1970 RepID=A0A7Y7B6P1_STRMO|nr:hypothetical protein [Streptomyces morookaense]NVK80038.1 hypothetical protein [Streptomyces morookaense]
MAVLEKGVVMPRTLMTTRARIAVVAATSIAGLLFSRGAAFADNPGDWGFTLNEEVQPGSTTEFYPTLACDPGDSSTAGCTYSKDMQFTVTTSHDATMTMVSNSSPLLDRGTGTPVGTCTVANATEIVCVPNTSGSVNDGDALITDDAVDLDVPDSDCNEDVVAFEWLYQGTDEGDDPSAVYTSGC